ncbi:hypothetical protein EVJ58_g2539 [Rhodofomes roseus]|uniref:Uncharacterized protein n=1 Tax=Rhodofomes roseus TaxID=34475 RepID=A0A4Y9YS83_9APHY|nr:hypothetical protein EVJ58_g2539 [Rhodofomes roseus]
MDLLRRILHLGNLRNRDILSVAATCRTLQRCAPMAYNSIHFPLDATCGSMPGLLRLMDHLTLLLRTFDDNRGHPTHVFRVSLFDPRSFPVEVSPPVEQGIDIFDALNESAEMYARLLSDLDYSLAQLIDPQTTPNLRAFILDASATGQLLPFLRTLMELARDDQRPLAELGLIRVYTSAGVTVPLPLTNDRPTMPVRNLQVKRITIRSEDVQLSRAFLAQPVGVRALDFRESVMTSEPWEAVFGGGLRTTGSARTVKQLCLTCGGRNPEFEDHSEFVSYALATGWGSLATLSISAFFKLEHLTVLGQCPLRRLRLTVNVDDQFMPEFGPHLLSGILDIFPNLEEIVLDHMRATLYSYSLTEELLVEWSTTVRQTPTLRVLALSALFVVEAIDCGSDYADVGTVCSDVEMSDSIETSLSLSDNLSNKANPMSPEYFFDELVAFSEDFFDRHLHSESLQELRFLYEDPESGYTESIGFRPHAVSRLALLPDEAERRAYVAVHVDTAYDVFWQPRWRQKPDDYFRSFLYTYEDRQNED